MHSFKVSIFNFSDVNQGIVFPYSKFRDKTVQRIDAQVEFIAGDGFGYHETQIVQGDVSVAINGSVGAKAEDVFNGLKGSRYGEVPEQRLFSIKGS